MSENKTGETLLARAEKAFSSSSQQCNALCGDLRSTAAQLEQAELSGATPEQIERLNARYLAISQRMQNLDCPPCNIF